MSHLGLSWSPNVAHALLRAVSRLISTPALLFDTVCESCARTGRREASRRGTQECVRYVGDHLAHSGSSSFLDIRRSDLLLSVTHEAQHFVRCFDGIGLSRTQLSASFWNETAFNIVTGCIGPDTSFAA